MTLAETMEDIAAALAPIQAEIDGLQVYAFLNSNPTPPALDIYPGAPFQTGAGFGVGQSQVWFTIRARVSTADQTCARQERDRLGHRPTRYAGGATRTTSSPT